MEILNLNLNDPNRSIQNLVNGINFLLEEFAPHRKLKKHEIKLKTKPWITKKIQYLMWERDKVFKNYKSYFDKNQQKSAALWKGIRSLVNIKPTNKSDISIIDNNGSILTDPSKIVNCFNQYFVNVGPTVESKIPISNIDFTSNLQNIRINNSFFLKPATIDEALDIIHSLDINKSLGPNSIPVYVLKLCKDFFSNSLVKIVNLSFATGIFPDFCKIARVVPIHKKEDPLN